MDAFSYDRAQNPADALSRLRRVPRSLAQSIHWPGQLKVCLVTTLMAKDYSTTCNSATVYR